jgi:hypothetical protein
LRRNTQPYKLTISQESINEQLQKFKEQYEIELHAKNIKILPYPEVGHKSIVAKELNNKKPFKDSSKGYRDALIWETVKSELVPVKDLFEECQIQLLTRNTKDFADGNGLHQDLKDDLLTLGYGDNVVKLVTDCEEFFKDIIYPQFKELDRVKEALNTKGYYNRISVHNDIAQMFSVQFVEHILDAVDENGLPTYLPLYCEGSYVELLEEPKVEIDSVIRLEDETVMIGCNVKISAEIGCSIEKSNLGDSYDDIHSHIMNYEQNKHYLEVLNHIELNVVANIRTTKAFSKVLTTEIISRSIDFVPYK